MKFVELISRNEFSQSEWSILDGVIFCDVCVGKKPLVFVVYNAGMQNCIDFFCLALTICCLCPQIP